MEKVTNGNILIIDDNLANGRMIEDTLLPLGYQIIIAQNETFAIAKTKAMVFDLILIDYNLQGGSGISICNVIKNQPENINVPIIIISSVGDKATINKIMESKASDYIIRPFSRNELVARITPYIELSTIKKQNDKNNEKIIENISNKNEFLIKMGHAIRTQLNSIINAVELINDSDLNDNQKECVNIIGSSTDSLFELIKDVMDYSRIESGTIILETVSFDLHKNIEEVIHEFSPQANSKNLNFELVFEDVTPVIVYGDPKRFSQVLSSLISNAIKFTSKGGVKVLIKAPKHTGDRRAKIAFEVADTGIGISKEGIKQLFQTFTSIDGQIKDSQLSGNGLELIIAKKLVELMGGEIGVRSELGEGSVFWFTVDFEVFKGHIAADDVKGPANEPTEFRALNVLLVEDNPINNRVAVFALQKLGHKVDSVLNGLDAVNKFQPGSYDIIMMDISMPVMDGFETTKRIREIENSKGASKPVKIIAMTANAIKGDREKCFDSGMDEYISKPFRLEDLIRILQ